MVEATLVLAVLVRSLDWAVPADYVLRPKDVGFVGRTHETAGDHERRKGSVSRQEMSVK